MNKKIISAVAIISFLGLIIFLSLNRHSKAGIQNFHSEIWADNAGYYVYLPAVFKYNFNPDLFPERIDTLTGGGFKLDLGEKKVITKYSYGVALMQAPFYLAADAFARSTSQKSDGFSKIYHNSINVAAAFYLVAGLIFLIRFLRYRYSLKISIVTTFLIFGATNLYYYSIDETGMSHVYSFFLASALIYFFRKTNYFVQTSFYSLILAGFMVGLVIVIRPTNALLILAIALLDLKNKNELITRFKTLLKKWVPITIGITVAFVPQLIYSYYAYGALFHYSYTNEAFDFSTPQLIKFWFAPRNGLIPYTPIFLLILIMIVIMIKKKMQNSWLLLTFFLVMSYILSSWWDWGFGCGFGSRSFVEFYPLFCIPLAYFIQILFDSKKYLFPGFVLLLSLIILNLKIFYSFDDCYYGDELDWTNYMRYIFGPTL